MSCVDCCSTPRWVTIQNLELIDCSLRQLCINGPISNWRFATCTRQACSAQCIGCCRQAKIDSLRGLAVCIEAWGWQGVAAYSGRIWWALRDELVDPLEPSVDEVGSSTAVAAADCLRRCLLAETQLQSKIPDLQTRQPVQSLLDKVVCCKPC